MTVVTTHKSHYDADDMKVTLEGQRLINIGKDIEPEKTDGESVGMILFRGKAGLFSDKGSRGPWAILRLPGNGTCP